MIGGWTLLGCYGGLCALFALAVAWERRRGLGPRADALDAVQLDEHELAILNGGPELAITSAAVKLRTNLVAQPGRGPRTFVAAGQLDGGAAPLEHELFSAMRRGRGISARELLRELGDCDAVRRLVAGLTEAGFLQDGSAVSRLRRLGGAGAALVVLGLAVVVATSRHRDPNPVALAGVLTVAMGTATLRLACARQRATARGRSVLERLREQRPELRSAPHRSELALAVALFGGAAVWAVDPGFAAAWGVSTGQGMWWSGGGACGGCGGGCGGCGGCG